MFAWRLQDGELEVDVVPLADLVDGADLVAAVNGLLPATIPRGHALLGEVLGACLADAELLSRPVAPAGRPLSVVPAWPT